MGLEVNPSLEKKKKNHILAVYEEIYMAPRISP